jgi:hypothetical protein
MENKFQYIQLENGGAHGMSIAKDDKGEQFLSYHRHFDGGHYIRPLVVKKTDKIEVIGGLIFNNGVYVRPIVENITPLVKIIKSDDKFTNLGFDDRLNKFFTEQAEICKKWGTTSPNVIIIKIN